ncbi:MAG: acid phosphatase [Polyangiaceae bacterium]
MVCGAIAACAPGCNDSVSVDPSVRQTAKPRPVHESDIKHPCPPRLAPPPQTNDGAQALAKIEHFIVIYMENRSFDNLYGLFPGADGLVDDRCGLTTPPQVDAYNVAYPKLPGPDAIAEPFNDLANQPYDIGKLLPIGLPTTVDPIHRFFTQQAQINAGAMNQFVAFSNARALTLGFYDTTQLPVARLAEQFTVCDRFFHSAFGGSFLNHMWLVSARTPVYPNAPPDQIEKGDIGPLPFPVNSEGFFSGEDAMVTADGYAVNTVMSVNLTPLGLTGALLPSQTDPTIGDRLSAAGVSWAWYSGGWNEVTAHLESSGALPEGGLTARGSLFGYHHQPLAYFETFAPGSQARREHLKDEEDFREAARNGTLPAVSFVKPSGVDDEHPLMATLTRGQEYVSELVGLIMDSPNWQTSAIILTYDENGGFADHVPPPVIDRWGPGVRVPAPILSPFAKKGFVDHTQYETVSILTTLERRFGLEPLSDRDANANDLTPALTLGP